MRTYKAVAASVVSALSVAALAGCGGAGTGGGAAAAPTAPSRAASSRGADAGTTADTALYRRATQALFDAPSVTATLAGETSATGTPVRASGTVTSDKKKRCVADVHLTQLGHVQVVADGGMLYAKAGPSLLRTVIGAADVAKVGDRFVGGPAGNALFAPVEGICAIRTLAAGTDLVDTGTPRSVTRGAATEVAGRRAITLHVTQSDGRHVTAEVAAQGAPIVLRLRDAEGRDSKGANDLSFTFSRFGAPLTVRRPPADQVVDVAGLGAASTR
jgi:hypothetical protein